MTQICGLRWWVVALISLGAVINYLSYLVFSQKLRFVSGFCAAPENGEFWGIVNWPDGHAIRRKKMVPFDCAGRGEP